MSGGPDLSDAGLDMSNYTVASDFLAALLDDTTLQQSDYAIARAFWYGIVIVIVLVGIANWGRWALLKFRFVASKFTRQQCTANPGVAQITRRGIKSPAACKPF